MKMNLDLCCNKNEPKKKQCKVNANSKFVLTRLTRFAYSMYVLRVQRMNKIKLFHSFKFI